MGCDPATDTPCSSDSRAHRVVLTKSIAMGTFLITEEQWNDIMGFYEGVHTALELCSTV
jgi:hypothetical protein